MQDSTGCTSLQDWKNRSAAATEDSGFSVFVGRRRRNRRTNTAKFSCFFFLKPVSSYFFSSRSCWSRLLRVAQLFSRRGGGFSNPFTWTQWICPTHRLQLPNSPTPTLPSHLIQVEGTLTLLFLFKNTDDKTHQYTTGGWEGCRLFEERNK